MEAVERLVVRPERPVPPLRMRLEGEVGLPSRLAHAVPLLVRDGRIFPVDWESAAIAPGEIDLAALTEAWGDAATGACVAAYRDARAGGPASGEFERTFDAARAYLCFRWLGDRPEWTVAAESRALFERLHGVAARLGVLAGGRPR